jgi:cytochrome c oxidase cbb3-type subunit 3
MSLRCREVTLCVLALGALVSCEREERRFSEPSGASQPASSISISELRPGAAAKPPANTPSPYDGNAYAITQGKQLYEWFNCSGCHAQGGGAIGPPLMDDKWIYGGAAENIFATIVEGRPNGMPSFRGKIPTQQMWQIVAYVRSLSGQISKDTAPSRSDHLFTRKSEQQLPKREPVASSPPQPPPP